MAKEVFIRGVISPQELEGDFVEANQPIYSFQNLIDDLGDDKESTVYIDSIGGMVEEGLKMYEHLNKLNVKTVALNASSIASVMFLAGKERLVSPQAEMIIHNAWIKGAEIEDMTLNANSLSELKKEFEEMDRKLVNIYKEKTGLDESKLLALMAVESDIGKEAVSLGFATGYYEKELQAQKAYKNKLIMFNQKSIEMATEAAEKRLSTIEAMVKGLKNLFTGSAKNMLVKLQDGTEIYVFSEDGEFEGKRAVLAEDEMPTETNAPEGSHSLSDGRVIEVGADGIITAVKEAVDAEALKSEIAAMEDEKKKLMAEKEALALEVKALKEANEAKEGEFKAQFKALQEEIETLKTEVMGGGDDDPKPDFKALSQEELQKLSFAERIAIQAKAKIRESKNI